MHTDKERADAGAEGGRDSGEEIQEENLSWLLEMDRSEPEERLFKLDAEEFQEPGLTEYEAELAGRPLSRTGSASDDISSFVAEEIVVSSDGHDTRPRGKLDRNEVYESAVPASTGKFKAIDHSLKVSVSEPDTLTRVDEGSDILGLAENDDMGETFLAIKRVKAPATRAAAAPVAEREATSPLNLLDDEGSTPEEPTQEVIEPVALSPGLGVSEIPDEVVAQEANLGADSAGTDEAEDFGWLGADTWVTETDLVGISSELSGEGGQVSADDLEMLAPGADLSSDQPELPGAGEWLGDLSLDLAEVGASLNDDRTEVTESNEWLGDVDLELTELSDEPAPVDAPEPEFDDWLGDVELELTEQESGDQLEDDWNVGGSDLELTEMVIEEDGAIERDAAEAEVFGDKGADDEPVDTDSFVGLAVEEIASPPELSQSDGWLTEGCAESEGLLLNTNVDAVNTQETDNSDGSSTMASLVALQVEAGLVDSEDSDEQSAEHESLSHNSLDDGDSERMDAQDQASCGPECTDNKGEVDLSEAPVTARVAAPGDHAVANEDVTVATVQEGQSDELARGDTVLDYVCEHQAPLDDEEFDAYLLRGAHLQDSASDLDALAVEQTEGMAPVDPRAEVAIDYHEDFHALEALPQSSIVAITAVISEVMEEISGLARDQAQQAGVAASAIEVDVMLGSDAQTISQCQAEGFEPVGTVVTELPVALRDLDKAEIDAIYVRLFNGQTNESCNRLFSDAIPSGQELPASADDVSSTARDVLRETSDAEVEETPEAIFGDDIFGDESMDAWMDSGLPEAADDIEAQFDGFAEQLGDDELESPALDASVAQPACSSSDSGGDAMGRLDDLNEEDDSASEGAAPQADSLESAAQDDQALSQGFAEDIFDTELSGDVPDTAAADVGDIDTIFAGLEIEESDSDAICGVDVDEFAETNDTELLARVAQGDDSQELVVPQTGGADLGWCIPAGIAFDRSSQSGTEIFADFLDAFIEEGAANIEKLEDAIGEWERDVASEAAFVPVGRLLHTLKGIAKGVGLQRYGTLIHNFETLLEGMARPEPGAELDYFRIVNAWLDAAVRGLDFVRENRADVASEFPIPVENEAAAAQSMDAGPDAADVVEETDDAISRNAVSQAVAARQKKRDQQLADDGAKALAAQQSVRITSEKLDHLLNLTNQAQQLGVRSAQSSNRSKRASAELQGRLSSVRSHIAKIADRALLNVTARGGDQPVSEMDALEMDQYSELQEAANILREAVEDLADLVDVSSRHTAVLEAQLKQQATVISTIGSSIQAARVVPVSRLMPGLRRIIRTVSADLDKSVAFKVLNETGALDRDHYARCQVILEHMVRNALDHGIESPEERLAAGKATTGRISIDVRKSGGDYFITLTDDGRGIDPYEMRESAFRKGLDIDVDALSDEEAIRLIFHKGFSTASAVSEISGRGVGMDIVLNELQQIGGDIQVQSQVGQGTTFEVHIPANVTVNGALFVTAGEGSYAIPLHGLVAVEHVPVAEFFDAVEQGNTLHLFDMDCEPAYLATLCHGESLPERDAWGDTVPVIIAGSQKRHMAIAIDHVKEALELVIRSLGPQFANVPGVAGGATTADGEAIVALDLNVLVESVVVGNLSAVSVERSKDETLLALVVDDSRTQRMVTTSQFDTVGVETITAENGLVAIDLLNTTHRLPDVVLLDVEMPVKDGIETLKEIRKSARYKHLPVIMVTSRTGAKHRALAEEAGCNGYMGKPFNFPGLIEQINELTGYDLQVS